jgi:hypothetical protein
MKTQLDDLRQELKDIDKTLIKDVPNELKLKLLKRQEIVRSIIINIQ